MSNHNYNSYYKKFEEKQNNAVEPEKATPEVVPEVTATAPEITPAVAPEVTNDSNVATVDNTEPEVTAEPEALNGVVCNCAKLNVREKPAAGSRVVSIIDAGTELAVTTDESFGIFYKICTESGVEGYCIKDYVRLV